jgi:hypothetical protein
MAMHYTGVTDGVMVMDSCTETVTEGGKLILCLTYCALTGEVGEDKSVMLLQEQNKKIGNSLIITWNMAGWGCKFSVDSC